MAEKRGAEGKGHISTDTPIFTDIEKEAIRILREYGEKNPDRWVDCNRLGKRLYAQSDSSDKTSIKQPRSAAWNVIQRLEQKLAVIGVELKRTESSVYGTVVYSLDCEAEKKIEKAGVDLWPKRNEELAVMYLGELGFGTKAYDPRAGKALGYLLELNKKDGKTLRTGLDGVVLSGGIIPFVPEFYTSAIGANSMHLLDRTPRDVADLGESEAERVVAEYLENVQMDEELREFLKKHVASKILTKSDAVKTAKARLEDILGHDFDAPIHYVYGEEDDANLQQLKEMEIVRHMEETAKLQKQQKELEKDTEKFRKERDAYMQQKDMLDNMRIWLARAAKCNASDFEENVADFVRHHKKDISRLNKISKKLGDNVVEILAKAKSKADVEGKIREVSESLEKVQAEIKDADLRYEDVDNRLNAIKRVKEAPGFFKITKRVHINSQQHEIIHAVVSRNYKDLLKAIYPGKNFHLHPDYRADVTIKDRFFRLEHTMNLRSRNPEKDAIARMKEQSNLANKRGQKVPDVYVTSHGTGMRHQPQPKYREETEKGKYRETPEVNMLVKTGSFHSNSKLEYLLRNKQNKNWTVKRYENNYSSGAFIHRMAPDGRQSIECIPTENLVELGMVAEKIEETRAAIKTARPNEKKELEARIKKLEGEFLFDEKDLIKITMLTDGHIGCPNWPGRPSNYAMIEAAVRYEESTRLPDVLVMTEMLHGALTKPFWSDKEVHRLAHPQLEQAIFKINNNASLSLEEKAKLLSTLSLMQEEQTPITSLDDQACVFDTKVAPFAKKVIANGGLVVLASGNHSQKSSPGVTDEATSLSRAFSDEEKKNVYLHQAKGISCGAGPVSLDRLDDPRTIYVAHRMKRGSDEITALKEQTTGMNLKDTLVLAGDAHQAGAEYADGTAHAIGAGLQPWNLYVDEIGKQAGLRGIINVYLSRNPKLKNYFRIDYVLDPVLEKEINERIGLEKKLVERYLPRH